MNADFAGIGELIGIFHKVEEYLPKFAFVDQNGGKMFRDFNNQIIVLFYHQWLKVIIEFLNYINQRAVMIIKVDFSRLITGELKYLTCQR